MSNGLSQVPYDFELFNILAKLSTISKGMVFVKESDKVVLRLKNNSVSVIFDTNVRNFDFLGNDIAFSDFEGFHDFFKLFKDAPQLFQDTEFRMILQDGNYRINYQTTEPKILEKSTFNGRVDAGEECFRFNFDKQNVTTVATMVKKIKPERVKVITSGQKVCFSLINEVTHTTFDMDIPVEESLKDFSIDFKPDIFTLIPQDQNYELIYFKRGLLEMKNQNDKYNISLFSTTLIKAKK